MNKFDNLTSHSSARIDLKTASEEERDDETVVIACVSREGESLRWASSRLKDEENIVACATKECWEAINYSSDRIQNDRSFVMSVLMDSESLMDKASYGLEGEEALFDAILHVFSEDSYNLCDFPNCLRDDERVVMCAVSQKRFQLRYASDRIRNDETILRKAIAIDGCNLECANEKLKDDYDLVMAAVSEAGYALRYASDRLQDDETIVETAIAKYSKAIEFASPRLQAKLGR